MRLSTISFQLPEIKLTEAEILANLLYPADPPRSEAPPASVPRR